jgi:hypothetical protein
MFVSVVRAGIAPGHDFNETIGQERGRREAGRRCPLVGLTIWAFGIVPTHIGEDRAYLLRS